MRSPQMMKIKCLRIENIQQLLYDVVEDSIFDGIYKVDNAKKLMEEIAKKFTKLDKNDKHHY